jgi:glycosyltransferase involved in cell wall biosynthesis
LNPLISVIVPCYNQAQYLDECLQSVLDQTYQNWECIIVNDGSPDHTEEVVKKWVENGAVIYVCGSINGMASDVHHALIEILGESTVDQLQQDGRYRRDVY